MRISSPFASISIVCELSRYMETGSCMGKQFFRRILRFYSDLDHILFMKCKVKGIGFSNWIRYLAGSFSKTRNRIVKRTGRDPVLSAPCRIRQTALPALSHQFHPFIQGTPWGTFVSHNETSMCSEFLSPINGME